jgi:hypothetical protein
MSETKSEKKRELSRIQRFMCICAGVDKEILKQCPTEWNKYTGIGATIFFTGVLASLSGGYALYTVFRNGNIDVIDKDAMPFALAFGLLWGLIIFNLDRFIVSTFRKVEAGEWWQKLLKELGQVSPRIVLAVIIAVVISKPIEIKIFESRLAEQVKQNEIAAKKAKIDDFNTIHQIGEKERHVNKLDTTITKLQTELTTDPQNVKDLINNDLAKTNSELSATQRANQPRIDNHNQLIRNIRNNQSNYRPTYDAYNNVIGQSLTKEANDNIKSHKIEIGRLRGEIRTKQQEVDKINRQISEERALYRQQKNQEITDKKQEKDSAEVQLKTASQTAEIEAADANKTSEKAFSNNFITQIEALGDLTEADTTMNIVSRFLTLLFLTIELAPILTKLITKRGPYDEILERTEYEMLIEQKEIISRRNSEINGLLKQAEDAAKLQVEVVNRIAKDKADAELKNNKEILDDIAKKQLELAKMAIDEWYKKEKEKVKTAYTTTRTT